MNALCPEAPGSEPRPTICPEELIASALKSCQPEPAGIRLLRSCIWPSEYRKG